jgi:hypothetical protein
MRTRFRFEKLEVWQEARRINQAIYVSENDLDPLFDELERLARRIASLNRSLEVETAKTPFARPARQQSPRPSTLDPRP